MAPNLSDIGGGPALAVAGLSAGYGAALALRDFDMRVGQGEVVAILGPNGAGKTTLLRTLCGSLRPSTGSVNLFGQEIAGTSPWHIARQGIAHVPQGRRCFASLTVEENLRLGGFHLDGRQLGSKMEDVYQMFPVLRQKRAQDSATLSGGQQQMLAIGRGLMSSPRVLLLDEPSLGLAPVLVQEMSETLRGLARQTSISIVLAEQNSRLALRIASRAYVLQGGRCVTEGASEAIAPHLQTAYLGADAPESIAR